MRELNRKYCASPQIGQTLRFCHSYKKVNMELIYKRHQCQTKMKRLLFESNQIWIQLDQDLGGWKEDLDVVGLAHKGEGHACLGFCQDSPGFMKRMQTCNLVLEMLPLRLPQGLCYCRALKIWFCGAKGVESSSFFTNNSTACCGGRIN